MEINLRPIRKEDFSLLKRWQSLPHIMEVWGNSKHEEPYEQYVFRTNDGSVRQFVIEVDESPIGYFQFYWASLVGDGWWEGFDSETVGIDFYIGETGWLGKNLGAQVISTVKEMLFADPKVRRIIADPSPENKRIIYILGKAGFLAQGEINTPDGRGLLMEFRR